jgi:uncharacterized protein (DUF433 family)/DNA-binding transcriptional MerR regulator
MENAPPLGIGYYTVTEASQLARIPALRIRRWLGGYHFASRDQTYFSEPLWAPQLARANGHLELGFRDLIELRFVDAFERAGLSLQAIRKCLAVAREAVGDERPFSTARFRTDGRTIFLQALSDSDEPKLLDLARKQYAFNQIVEPTFKDIELLDGVPARWWPFDGKKTIVVDPTRAFGQPLVSACGIPTAVLAEAVSVEGSPAKAARAYEVPLKLVRDAVRFEQELHS